MNRSKVAQLLGCMGTMAGCSGFYSGQAIRQETKMVQHQIEQDLDAYKKNIEQNDPIVKQWNGPGKIYYVGTGNDTAFQNKPKSNLFVHNLVFDAANKSTIDEQLKQEISAGLKRSESIWPWLAGELGNPDLEISVLPIQKTIDFIKDPKSMCNLKKGVVFATQAKDSVVGGSGSVAFSLGKGWFLSASPLNGLRTFDMRQVLEWHNSPEGIAFTKTPAVVREFSAPDQK